MSFNTVKHMIVLRKLLHELQNILLICFQWIVYISIICLCVCILPQDYCGSAQTNGSFRVITENVPCGTTGTTCSKTIKIFLGVDSPFRKQLHFWSLHKLQTQSAFRLKSCFPFYFKAFCSCNLPDYTNILKKKTTSTIKSLDFWGWSWWN